VAIVHCTAKIFPTTSLVESANGQKVCKIVGDPHVTNMENEKFNFNLINGWQTAFRRGSLQIQTMETSSNYWVWKVKITNGNNSPVVYTTDYRRRSNSYGNDGKFGLADGPLKFTQKTLRFNDVTVKLTAHKQWSSIPTSLNIKITYSGSASQHQLGGYCVWSASDRRSYRVNRETWERVEKMGRKWPCSFPKAIKKCGGKKNWPCIEDLLRVGRNCVTTADDCNWKYHKRQHKHHAKKAANYKQRHNQLLKKIKKNKQAISKLEEAQALVNKPCIRSTITQLRQEIQTAKNHKQRLFHHKTKAECHAKFKTKTAGWQTLFTASGRNKNYINKWQGWYNKGHLGDKKNAYDALPLRRIKVTDSNGRYATYKLRSQYRGQTAQQIVSGSVPPNSRSEGNTGTFTWRMGHAVIGDLVRSTISGVNQQLRLAVGDGSHDREDWALFMFMPGNGGGDFAGNNHFNLGGEYYTSDSKVSRITLRGQ
jgi:hypothetical protein